MRVNILATTIMVLAIGCGDDASGTPDGAPPKDPDAALPPDGTVDTLACTPSGGPGPVVVDGPSGDASLQVTVVVHDQAGAVVSRSATLGPDATTTVDVPSCGMVSLLAVDPNDKGPGDIVTWTNVQPGDHLVHVQRRVQNVETPISITLPALAGATSYRVFATCPGGGLSISFNPQPGTVELSPNCPPGAGTVTVLALAKTATSASTSLATVAIAASGTTAVPLPGYTTAPTVTATVRGASVFSGLDGVFQTQALIGAANLPIDFVQATVGAGDLTLAATPTIAGPGVLTLSMNGQKRSTDLHRVVATQPATLEVQADEFLPIPSATVDTAARPTATWTVDRAFGADPADLGSIELSYNADEAGTFSWAILTPPVPGTVRFPEMPADLVPAGTATIRSTFVLSSTALDGYGEARNKLNEAFRTPPPPGNTFRTSSSRP